MRVTTVALSALLLLSACGRGQDEGNGNAGLDTPIDRSGEEMTGEESESTPAIPPPPVAGGEQARITTPGTLPRAFRGQWAGLNADCDDSRSDMRLTVGASELRFYESLGQVMEVEQTGPDTVIVNARYEGEGQSWKQQETLSLSPDGGRLTIIDAGSAVVRKRCPEAP